MRTSDGNSRRLRRAAHGMGRSLGTARSTARSRIWLLETAFIAAAIAVVGAMLRPDDPALLSINPTPYLLLPALLAAQYGITAGVGGAIAALLARSAVVVWSGTVSPVPGLDGTLALGDWLASLATALAIEPSLLVALGAIAVLLGGLREGLDFEVGQLHALGDNLAEQIESLACENLLLKETKSSLERRLAEIADSQSTIFDEAADLYAMDGSRIEQGILRMLGKYASVEQAALYRMVDGELELGAQTGTDDYRPPAVDPHDSLIVRAAIDSRRTVTVRDLDQGPGGDGPGRGLIAAPLVARPVGGRHRAATGDDNRPDSTLLGVIVVDAIPFIRLNDDTVRLISLITDWGAQVIHDLDARQDAAEQGLIDPILQVYRAPYMHQRLEDELRRARRFKLDLNLLAMTPASIGASDMHREGLGLLMVAAAREGSRPGEVLGLSDSGAPHAVMILPMTDGAGAKRRLRLIESLWAGRVREQLLGEELPPLAALQISSRELESGEDAWRRIEHWLATHGGPQPAMDGDRR